MTDKTSRACSELVPRPRGVIMSARRMESHKPTREQPAPSARFETGSEITIGGDKGTVQPRDGFATGARRRVADKVAHILINDSKTAADPKQLPEAIEGFCERKVSPLLSFPRPPLLLEDPYAIEALSFPADNFRGTRVSRDVAQSRGAHTHSAAGAANSRR